MQFAFRNSDNNLPSHDLSFMMGITVILSGKVVPVSAEGFVRRKLFKPSFIVLMQSGFVIIDKYRSGYMHRIDKAESFLYSTFPESHFDIARNVNKTHSCRKLHPEFLMVGFHQI